MSPEPGSAMRVAAEISRPSAAGAFFSLFAGVACAMLGLYFTGFRGEGTPDIKSVVIGADLFLLATLGVWATFFVRGASTEVGRDGAVLDEASKATYPLVAVGSRGQLAEAVEAARRRAPIDPGSGTAQTLARRYSSLRSRAVDPARRYAAAAVYLGLAGTLVGLTVAVIGLKGLGGQVDPNAMKDHILSVVGGFGSSFAAALVGVFGTLLVGRSLSVYDSAVEETADHLESFLAEKALPAFSTGDQTAAAIRKAITGAMEGGFEPIVSSLKTLNETLQSSSEASTALTTSISEATGATREQIAGLATGIAAFSEAAASAKSSAADSAAAAKSMGPAAANLTAAYAAQKPALDRLTDALVDVEKLADGFEHTRDAARALDEASRELPARTQAVIDMMRGEFKAAHKEIEQALVQQADHFKEAVQALFGCTQSLHILIGELDERLRDAELGIPAGRLVQELSEAGAMAKETISREMAAAQSANSRLEEAERHVATIAREIDEASRTSADNADAARKASEATQASVEHLRAHVERTTADRIRALFGRSD